jgi:hypothetical protein
MWEAKIGLQTTDFVTITLFPVTNNKADTKSATFTRLFILERKN